MTMEDLERRVAQLEATVVQLTSTARTEADPTSTSRPGADSGDDPFWALHGLEARVPDAVVMAGSLNPDEGPVQWQVTLPRPTLMEFDWTDLAATMDALAHPARLTILQLVMSGIRTTGSLLEQESLGTTGQLHHHLRQLVAAGWLVSGQRGRYDVPPERVVPLLVMIMAARR